jgi:hypothetical protein
MLLKVVKYALRAKCDTVNCIIDPSNELGGVVGVLMLRWMIGRKLKNCIIPIDHYRNAQRMQLIDNILVLLMERPNDVGKIIVLVGVV